MLDREIAPGLWIREDATVPPGFIYFKDGDRLLRLVSIMDVQQKKPSEIYDELVAWLDSEDLIPSPQDFDILAARAFALDRELAWALERGQFDRAKEYAAKADEAYKVLQRFYRKTWEATGANLESPEEAGE